MGWGRFFLLGDIGQQLDLQDRQRELDQLRQHADSQWSRDQNQDAQIEMLQNEVRDLKLYVASLVRLLGTKGTITQADVAEMVQLVDPDTPGSRK